MKKYDYNICTNADEKIFQDQCQALEKYIPNIVKSNYLKMLTVLKHNAIIKTRKKFW